MRIFLYILSGILLAGCLQKEPEITVLQTESWTDLMPGTPGKTYLQAKFSISDASADNIKVIGIKVNWSEGNYNLNEEEYEFSTADGDSNNVELSLRGVFILNEKDIDTLNAEIEFFFNESSVVYKLENIFVEKVY